MTRHLDRRAFLKHSCQGGIGALLALNFGCSARQAVDSGLNSRTAIIYATRYGSTQDTAGWIQQGLGSNAALLDIETLDASQTLADYDHLVLGSGVWVGGVHRQLKALLTKHSQALKDRVIATFVVCGTRGDTEAERQGIARYLDQIHQALGYTPQFVAHFGGRIVVEKLTEKDRAALTRFYKNFLNRPLASWDRTDPSGANRFGESMQTVLEKLHRA
ncbi:MAG TPA: hypothetical protein ENJ80_15510 [Gammaproteobacteria bacterium]|nr:hypothetical protein [Gammaproteobacteria bacterium]